MTTILSAVLIVDRRWATITVVRPLLTYQDLRQKKVIFSVHINKHFQQRGKIKKYLLCMPGIPRGSKNNKQKNKTCQNTKIKTELLIIYGCSTTTLSIVRLSDISYHHNKKIYTSMRTKEQEWPTMWHYWNFVLIIVKHAHIIVQTNQETYII